MWKWMWRIGGGAVAIACIVAAIGYYEARSTPVVRRATVALPDWPAAAPPVTIALIADIHMASATMDEARLARIVAEVNGLHPDLVLLAGDFVEGSGRREAARALPILARQLGKLRPRLGSIAVLGNHDYWTDPSAVTAMLRAAGITVLANQAAERGPLAIGGAGDVFTRHADVPQTVAAMRRLPGARILLTHSPDAVHALPADVHLLLAGHTHCGQIVLPVIGAPIDVADPRYRCGLIRDPGRATIVTAGVGTSDVPLRLGAPPDIWLIRLAPTGG